MFSLNDTALRLTSRKQLWRGRHRVKMSCRAQQPHRARPEVETLESRLVPAALVLGADGKL
jgi:hypothetical protein